MEPSRRKAELPPIPAKRYFTIGEVSDLCGVKPHVLRYWEQEFTQLKPVKRRGNRRYNTLNGDEKVEAPARNGARANGGSGVDVAAIKRELRALLDQLQR